jgi:hypothetical protein
MSEPFNAKIWEALQNLEMGKIERGTAAKIIDDELANLRRDLDFFRKLAETYRQTSEEFRTIGEGWFKEKERYRMALKELKFQVSDECAACSLGAWIIQNALNFRPEQEEVRGKEEGK